jgi:hypothetical protein
MENDAAKRIAELEEKWSSAQRQWRRRLGRLRLGVEPIEEQVERYRRVSLTLMAVQGFMALFFFTLFSVFGRPDIGLVVVAVLFVPMIVSSWLGFKRMQWRANTYQVELAAFEEEKRRLQEAAARPGTSSRSG